MDSATWLKSLWRSALSEADESKNREVFPGDQGEDTTSGNPGKADCSPWLTDCIYSQTRRMEDMKREGMQDLKEELTRLWKELRSLTSEGKSLRNSVRE